MAAMFTCTACAVTFDDSEAHKTHYKLDWHRYNLRRKVAGLAPVDQGDFDRRLAAALGSSAPKPEFQGRCKECRKSFRSEGLYKQHLQTKKHKDAVKTAASTTTSAVNPSPTSTSSPPSQTPTDTTGGGTDATASEATPSLGNNTVGTEQRPAVTLSSTKSPLKAEGEKGGNHDDMMVQSEEEEEEGGDEAEMSPPRMGQLVCIFCNGEAKTFEDNCAHMLHEHGFFIPDVEYLADPEGLVGYVEEKVKLGHICLYCNGKGKTFHTYRSLQQHMTDRSHCKLLYEEGEDLHEYESFYDFSASYSDAEKRGLIQDASAAGAGAGPGDDAMGESGDDDGKREGKAEDSDGEYIEVSRTLGVTDLGELVLFDGKTVGNRKWSRYYRQRLRAPDERDFVVAHRRATRLRLGAIYDEEVNKGTSTGGAVALQRGQRKAYGGLSGVAKPKDVKMLKAHQRIEARARLKTELRQNKLNKTFDRVADM